jgi:peptidylprolyl isomerase
MIKKTLLILAPILFLGLAFFFNENITNKSSSNVENNNLTASINTDAINKNMNLSKPSMQIDKNKNYTAILKTSEGAVEVSLNAKDTPVTVNNFVYLARNNFYDNTIFHRVVKDFMVQGGDPMGTGMGGPGYKFEDESFSGEYLRGTLAMANSGPNTNGSQFFITTADTSWLNMHHTIFGKVVSGYGVVEKIEDTDTGANDKPMAEQKIIRAYIKN